MSKKRKFNELENNILQIIKKRSSATVSDIYQELKPALAYTTIMTVMNRLFEKKILKREKKSKSYIYSIANSSYFSDFINKIKKTLFSEDCVEMVSYLLKGSPKITNSELEKIEKLIKEIKKKKP